MFLFSGSSPEMAVSVFSLRRDQERLVREVGRGRGGPCSQSVPDVFCRARRDWLAMTSCCSSGWGQSGRGRLLQRQRGRSDDGDRCCRGWYGTQAVAKRISRLFPEYFLLSLREVRAPARPLRNFGALARTRRRNYSHDFCNCVRARWRWVSLGRGGRGTSTAAAAHVTGLHSCGVWLRPRLGRGRGKGLGGGDCGAVGVGGLKRKRWLRAVALPHIAYSCGSRGKAPGGTLLTGCDGCWWWRFGALFSYLPFSLQSSYVRWQFPSVGVAVICESLRAAGLSKKRE